MSYPRNAATPPIVAVGAIYLLADGTIQTTGASVRVKTGAGAWGSGAGTLACDSTSGIWTYAPTQAETDAESFIVGVYKSASTSAQVTVATSASATAGYSGVDWSKITAATTTVNLSGTTISTTQQVASVSGSVGSVTGAVGSVTGNVGGNVVGSVGSISGVTFPTHFQNLEITANGHVSAVVQSIANNSITASSIQGGAITAAKFAADAISAAALAADAVQEIQSGLALAADLLIVSDRVSYSLAVLVGACSDAQTAAETYTLTIGGNTFTVDYSGLDSSGNRSTTTLSKT